jgi:outer membrane lipoprotein-sorting protein
MRLLRAVSAVVCIGMTAGLTGCFSTTRLVQKTMASQVYQTAPVEVVEKQVFDRDAAIKTLRAQVLVTATVGGSKEGEEKEYIGFKGYIFVQKPREMRLILQKPIIGSRAMDMVTDGDQFTMMMASVSGPDKWVQGSNQLTTPSKNGLENLRPDLFLDSLLIPGVKAEEYVSLTETSRVIAEETRRHDAVLEPVYELTISRLKEGHTLRRERVLHISRVTMLPYQQDIYDENGQVVTQATYENYTKYGETQFPAVITIKRPVDEYSLKIDVTKLTLNAEFEADQFKLDIPAGVTVKKLP